MSDDREFQKKLAHLQIGAIAVATFGSVIMAIGISMIVFSMGINLDSIGEESEKFQFYQVLVSSYLYSGTVAIFLGLGLVILALYLIRKKIDKLK